MKKILISILILMLWVSTVQICNAEAVSGEEFVDFARKNCIGVKYVSGGRSKSGFDCCGLVWYVCNHFGINVGSGNQNSQRNYGEAVAYSKNNYNDFIKSLQQGDLIFFDYENDGKSNHVGIYAGNGKIIQAHRAGVPSREDNLNGVWYNNKKEWQLTCAVRRVIGQSSNNLAVTTSKGISNPNQVVKNGSSGAGVIELQQSLNEIMNAGLDVDGKCGPKTVAAIKEFQKKYGLEVDGAAGPKTNAKINELLSHTHVYKNHYEKAHPHKRFKLCECGDKVYVEGGKLDSSCKICYPPHQHSFKTGYEKVHPHKVYKVCSCGEVEYTGELRKLDDCEECHEHNFVFETEKKHPHAEYRICNDCEYEEYTGEFTLIETCKLCYPEEKEKRTLKLQIGIPQMYIDGVRTEIDPGRGTVPIMKNNRTLLPVRAVVETFDAYVIWDENEEKITVIRDDITIQLWIDSTVAYVNDEEYELDVVPVMINSRTFMPLRFIAENLGLSVGWNEANQTVTVEGTI